MPVANGGESVAQPVRTHNQQELRSSLLSLSSPRWNERLDAVLHRLQVDIIRKRAVELLIGGTERQRETTTTTTRFSHSHWLSVMNFRKIPLSMPETVCMIGPTKPLFWTLNTLGQPVPRDLPHRSASWRRHQPSGGKDDSWVYTLRLAWHGQQRFRRTNFNSPRRVIAWNRPSRNELVNCTWFALNMS